MVDGIDFCFVCTLWWCSYTLLFLTTLCDDIRRNSILGPEELVTARYGVDSFGQFAAIVISLDRFYLSKSLQTYFIRSCNDMVVSFADA